MTVKMMNDARFYFARRDTRWDICPAEQPLQIVAHDWHGFWEWSDSFHGWFKTPASFNFVSEISR